MVAAAKAGVTLEGDGDQRDDRDGVGGLDLPHPDHPGAGGVALDTEDGLDEILARRIGGNELQAITVMRAYGPAQLAYATRDREGDAVLEHAQKLVGSPGLHGRPRTGRMRPGQIAAPSARWRPRTRATSRAAGPAIPITATISASLTRQDAGVPGGRYDYVINGNMIAGFALIAVPAEYGETGRMTFVVSHHGPILEKDLGDRTEVLAAAIESFPAAEGWDEVTPDSPERIEGSALRSVLGVVLAEPLLRQLRQRAVGLQRGQGGVDLGLQRLALGVLAEHQIGRDLGQQVAGRPLDRQAQLLGMVLLATIGSLTWASIRPSAMSSSTGVTLPS